METCNIMRSLPRLMQGYLNDELSSLGMSSMLFPYMIELSKEDGIGMLELSRRVAMDKANTSRVLGDLVSKGLVFRKEDADDKRLLRLYLTEKGKAVCFEVGTAMEKWRDILTEGLTQEETEQMVRIGTKMYQNALKSRGEACADG